MVRIIIVLFFLPAPSVAVAQDEALDVDAFIERSMEELIARTEEHDSTWGIASADTWKFDQEEGTISWQFSDGRTAVAPVQIVGTYNPADGSFLWGWDHPYVQAPLQAHARLVKEFGEEHGVQDFTTQKVYVTETEAWEFTAVASALAGASGAYKAHAKGPLVFMTFGEVEISRSGMPAQ